MPTVDVGVRNPPCQKSDARHRRGRHDAVVGGDAPDRGACGEGERSAGAELLREVAEQTQLLVVEA